MRGASRLNDAISHQHVLLNALLLDVQDLIGICADALAGDVIFHNENFIPKVNSNLYALVVVLWHIHVTGSC